MRGGFPIGADGGTRTRDLLITNQLLYQLSHISVAFFTTAVLYHKQWKFARGFRKIFRIFFPWFFHIF